MEGLQKEPPPHVISTTAICARYKVDIKKGLSTERVEKQFEIYGPNELKHAEGKSIWTLLVEQVQDLLARILIAAALISFLLALFSGEDGWTSFVEPLVIILILVANATVSIWQESHAEKSLEALKRLQPELAQVLRNGEWKTVASRDLVPGDICEVSAGDKVPADLRILRLNTVSLRAEQSELTGETNTVPKESIALNSSFSDCDLHSKINMLFASTTIANGSALAIVVTTGMNTEIGLIQSAVEAAGEEEEQTPLQQKLDEFGQTLSKVIGIICILVWLINFGNFNEPSHGGFVRGCIYYFKTAVALAVAAIPEGLTAVITTCLALGTRKMAQKNAIVRKLPSVETLGCTTVICTDKTGTLTTNEMSCICFVVPETPEKITTYNVESHTYEPVGKVVHADSEEEFTFIGSKDIGLQYFVQCASLCNTSRLLSWKNKKIQRQGEPTELAMKVLVEKLGCPDQKLNELNLQKKKRDPEAFCSYWAKVYKKLTILEFTRERKSMSVFYETKDLPTKVIQFVKGAPESVVERCKFVILPDGSTCDLSAAMKVEINLKVQSMTKEALRVLALAYKKDVPAKLADSIKEKMADLDVIRRTSSFVLEPEKFIFYEQDLTFCGLVGLIDPPRPEVKTAISLCKHAGIKVIMITGDNKNTAEAIAAKINIVPSGELPQVSFTGKEFDSLSDTQKCDVLRLSKYGVIFSRTEPKHKQLIIRILKELGEITAMTGDGVNDAPALKQADIGIAMGITGTEVAKEASDMILANDNFMSIVSAIEEGRSIYNNMKAFIRYLISSNIGEVASIFITAALGIPESFVPVQLLWVNLVTDGLPATALGFNPPDVNVMERGPRRHDEPLISTWVFLRYMIIGLYVGFATVGIFIFWFTLHADPLDNHTLLSYKQLSQWTRCHKWDTFEVTPVYGMDPSDPCSYFTAGKIKASTLSLTVLVVIEMFNALNALSEENSLLTMPPWSNPWLLLAIAGSIAVHCCILYVKSFATIFGVVPLSLMDWMMVLKWSLPVLFLDEALKALTRYKERQKLIRTKEKED